MLRGYGLLSSRSIRLGLGLLLLLEERRVMGVADAPNWS